MVLDPIAFRLFGLEVRWYGIFMALALLAGIILAYFIAKYRDQKADEIINFAPFAVIFAVLGARLVHVFANWSYYSEHLNYIFAFRRGGLAIQGVVLGGLLTLIVFCRIRKISFWAWADIIAPALALGQSIGRWGNYFNQEAFGKPTNLPWGIYIDPVNRPDVYSHAEYFHPTFFYEFLANIALFVLLILMHRYYKNKPGRLPEGIIFMMYLGIYAIYRTFVEYFRLDSVFVGSIKLVYIINFVTLVFAIIMSYYLIKRFNRNKNKTLDR